MHRYDFYYDTSVYGIPSTDVGHTLNAITYVIKCQ